MNNHLDPEIKRQIVKWYYAGLPVKAIIENLFLEFKIVKTKNAICGILYRERMQIRKQIKARNGSRSEKN